MSTEILTLYDLFAQYLERACSLIPDTAVFDTCLTEISEVINVLIRILLEVLWGTARLHLKVDFAAREFFE